ncbi:hypothetical protein BX616_000134 [Lobosporangium transversale]|uniref:Uncharacterized protein n=1 Tax=Lobosporangium transversale TaxID=64571 RepID=A0A1Y2GDX3_9FUNG|nr:hypothetical protein BCR41DRAFT_424976 [Lobosporangium transversale]KAF9917723.1 hypothetical protein BX616_000134 [Lobosporangium transversale]ORZ07067.1 hypothetical protein BCR41DRAFT_424976 [Lobosporangium transversale]|eukprot:XP_021877863.1 hypothetical protein BCR41DRAFT_424976 [Lobosporangium transversale]
MLHDVSTNCIMKLKLESTTALMHFYGCYRVAGVEENTLNPIQSGLVRSASSSKFGYGEAQIRAIWMLPAHYQYASWPANEEIDLIRDWRFSRHNVDNSLVLDVPFNNMFGEGKFPSWVDNLWAGPNSAPFDQEFYLIMNVTMAGIAEYFPDGVGGKLWSDNSPHAVNGPYAGKDDWLSSLGT